MNANFGLPFILQPTRVTEKSATLIDNIYGNTINNVATSGNIVINTSDHFPQFLIIKYLKTDHKTMNYYVNYCRKLDKNDFINDFANINWDDLYSSDMDCDEKFNMFLKKIATLFQPKFLFVNDLNVN